MAIDLDWGTEKTRRGGAAQTARKLKELNKVNQIFGKNEKLVNHL